MGCVFIADAHLTHIDEYTLSFISLLRKAWQEGVELFLLGDIFDLWFGEKKLTYPVQEKVIGEIADLAGKGLKISYIEGNRDFFIAGSWASSHFTRVSSSHLVLSLGSERIFLTHGDAVNREDRYYRFWKWLSKNRIVYRIFSLIPGKIALKFATKTEKTLKQTNRKFRYTFPEEAGISFARKKFTEGFHKVIIGHFHHEMIIPVEEANALICLPMWREKKRYYYVKEDGECGFRDFMENEPLIR